MKQLALFGDYAITDRKGIEVKQSYKKAGDKWKGKKDAKGFALDADGERIPTNARIGTLPMKSEDGPSLESVLGVKGAELKFAAANLRKELMTEGFAQLSRIVSAGTHTFKSMVVNRSNGHVTFSLKPASIQVVEKKLTDEELVALCKERNIVVK